MPTSTPPETHKREITETIHGDEITDPYRWLEDESEEVEEWIKRQNEYADKFLKNSDNRERLKSRFEELARTVEYNTVVGEKNGYFQRIRDVEEDHSVLYFFEELGGERRKLVDPNTFSDDDSVSMDWWTASKDGSLIAYGVAEGGDEQYDIKVMDIESREIVDEVPDAGRTGPMLLAWDRNGFYYVRTGSIGEGGQLDKRIMYHELNGENDEEVYTDIDTHVWPGLFTSEDGEHLVVAFQEGWQRTDVYYKHESDDEFEPLVTGEDAIFHPEIHGDKVYLRTTHEAPNYRVTAYDLNKRDGFEEIISEDTNGILKTIEVVGDRIVAQYERNAVSDMEIYTLDGEGVTHVDLPEYGTATELNGREVSNEFFFQFESFNQPPTVYRYDIPDQEMEVINQQDVEFDSEIVVKQEWYESKDGTEVPMFVIHKDGIKLDGNNPALVYGYGGFEVSVTPSFHKYKLPFVEDGGVFVQPNLRGGGEFGEEWHHAAMHEKKQNTFDDMIGAVEHLIERGYTREDKVGVMGGSNGGLTVGAVVTQRPDLVKACFCSVPLLDMLRFHKFLLGESWTTEYGSPDNQEDYEYIREYSPYHNVDERDYPAVMFKTADSDTRVHPAHARKMTALMQEKNTSDNPIILRTETSTGHGVGKPISKIVEEELDKWCFLYDQLGVYPT